MKERIKAKATLNNVSINFRTMGQGHDVVLIHGLGASQGFWGPRVLLPLARNYRVTLFDLRGHGYSEMPAVGYTLTDFATDLHHLLNLLDIDRADLIGHSFGGTVALQTAVLFPERVRSLVLADTRVRSLQSPANAAAMRESCLITKKLEDVGLFIPEDEEEAGLWLLERFASSLHDETMEKLKATEPFIPFVGKKGRTRSAERLLQLFETTSAKEELSKSIELNRGELSQIRQPTLAMCGESMLTKESLLGLQENIDRCQTVVFPKAGHFFPLTHSELFLKSVMDFLTKVSNGELREYKRFLLKIPVQLHANGMPPFSATTTNVSCKSLLVESPFRMKVGTEVLINLMMPGDGPQTPLPAKVARVMETESEDIVHLGIELQSVCKRLETGKPIPERAPLK